MTGVDAFRAAVRANGFCVLPQIVDDDSCVALAEFLEHEPMQGAGSRRLLQQPWCQVLARRIREHRAIAALLADDAVAVQCTAFDKSPEKNWLVSLHQDRSIPVRRRVDAPQLAGWSEKEGDLFVQPPAMVLEQVTAVRLHVDDCTLESGALRVVPGSHRRGVLPPPEAERLRDLRGEVPVPVPRGGALVMKPLLLHASSRATAPVRRRVLHFVFGPRELPLGLEWRQAV